MCINQFNLGTLECSKVHSMLIQHPFQLESLNVEPWKHQAVCSTHVHQLVALELVLPNI